MKLLALCAAIALVPFLAAPAAADKPITVTASNFAFTPAAITLKVHHPAKLTFVGKQGLHGITIPGIGLTQVVNIGTKPTVVVVNPARVGTFVAHCAIFCGVGHGKMILTVKVIK